MPSTKPCSSVIICCLLYLSVSVISSFTKALANMMPAARIQNTCSHRTHGTQIRSANSILATVQIQLTFLYRFKLEKFYNSLQHTQMMQCQSVALSRHGSVSYTNEEAPTMCLCVHLCLCKTASPVFVHVLAVSGTGASDPAGTLMM